MSVERSDYEPCHEHPAEWTHGTAPLLSDRYL